MGAGRYARQSGPALPGLDDDVRTRACRLGDDDGDRERPVRRHLYHHSHRMPAPMVRAMDASSATAQVKRARFAFTIRLLRVCLRCIRTPATGRSPRGRSLALRPRLATGLPWTVTPMEGFSPRFEALGRSVPGRLTQRYRPSVRSGGVAATHRRGRVSGRRRRRVRAPVLRRPHREDDHERDPDARSARRRC